MENASAALLWMRAVAEQGQTFHYQGDSIHTGLILPLNRILHFCTKTMQMENVPRISTVK